MLYLIIASLVWGLSFGLMKEYMVDLDPSFVAWGRLAVAVSVFLPFLRLRGLRGRVLVHLFLIGAFQYGVLYSIYTYAYQYLYGYQVALFTIVAPLYIAFIDSVYKKKWVWVNIVMAVLAVVGAGIIEWKGGVGFDRGVLYGFFLMQICNLCFSVGQMEYRRLRQRYTEIIDKEVYALLYMGAVIICSIWTTYTGGWHSLVEMRGEQIWVLLFLGVFATGISFFLWNVGATRVHAGALAVMNNVKVPLAVFVSLAVFGEEADYVRLLVGGSLMVLAVYLTERFR